MPRHLRINALITLLQQGPQTVESISRHFNKKVSPRQIRSDIEVIRAMGYGEQVSFEQTGPANRKTWQINLSDYERNTQRLSQGVLPEFVFAVKRYESLKKLTNWSMEDRNLTVESTHFYETEAHELLDERLERMMQSIDTNQKLLITNLTGDATSVGLIQLPLLVLPIKIAYHRGCFYVAAVTNETRQVLTFQIDQLTFEETNDTFKRAAFIEEVEANLDNRFGISQNIDDAVYDITLRFSSVTGKFISEQFWHKHQTVASVGDDWLITFHCGINRELVGWLFQWMSNVKIISPLKLKELYDEQLARMINVANQQPDESLVYSNLFAPAL